MTESNDPAFSSDTRPKGSNPTDFYGLEATGLTKREYFAAMAMQGLLTLCAGPWVTRNVAASSVDMADALIDELNK